MLYKMQEDEVYRTESEAEGSVMEDDEDDDEVGEVDEGDEGDEDDEEELLGKRKASPSPEPEKKKTCRRPSV